MRIIVMATVLAASLFWASGVHCEEARDGKEASSGTAKNGIPADWVKFNFANAVEFHGPSDMKNIPVQGIDSKCGLYKNGGIELHFDYGMYGTYFDPKQEGYKEIIEQIDGRKATIITSKRTVAVAFSVGGSHLTVYTSNTAESEIETVLKIFRSIKFITKIRE